MLINLLDLFLSLPNHSKFRVCTRSFACALEVSRVHSRFRVCTRDFACALEISRDHPNTYFHFPLISILTELISEEKLEKLIVVHFA